MRLTGIAVKTPSLPISRLKFRMAKGCIFSFIRMVPNTGDLLDLRPENSASLN